MYRFLIILSQSVSKKESFRIAESLLGKTNWTRSMCLCGYHQGMALWAHCALYHCTMCIAIRHAVVNYPRVPVICDLCRPFFNRLSLLYPAPTTAQETRIPGEHEVCSSCSLKIDVIFILGRQSLVQSTLCYACAKFLMDNFF